MGPPSEDGGNRLHADPLAGEHHASMGPPSEDGGNALAEHITVFHHLASMGPPSEDGGNETFGAGTYSTAVLQWGRRPRTAEILCPPTCRNLRRCFNGAAVRGRRKSQKPTP